MHRVASRLDRYLGEYLRFRIVFLEVIVTCRAETANCYRCRRVVEFIKYGRKALDRTLPVLIDSPQRTALHLFEAKCERTVYGTGLHGLAGQKQSGGPTGAGIIDVDDRNAGLKNIVQGMLAASGIAVYVCSVGLFNERGVNVRIIQGAPNGPGCHYPVRFLLTRLDKLHHINAGDNYFPRHSTPSFIARCPLSCNMRAASGSP